MSVTINIYYYTVTFTYFSLGNGGKLSPKYIDFSANMICFWLFYIKTFSKLTLIKTYILSHLIVISTSCTWYEYVRT